MNQLYFDLGELRKGNIYNLQSGIKTDEGHSFEIDEWIGRGGNASVFKGKNRSTGEECALKFLMHTNTNSTKRFLREVKLLRALDNDHIIKYIGSGRVCVTKNKSNKEISIPFVVMELADCNLQEMIELKGRLPYEQYAGQLITRTRKDTVDRPRGRRSLGDVNLYDRFSHEERRSSILQAEAKPSQAWDPSGQKAYFWD